jgi:NAD(P)H-hydrate epimerase
LARQSGATVLLKGPLTIIASPDGRAIASASGDARLATAGSGDVLAGMVGSYLAAGLEPVEAAALAAWMHGEAARTQARIGMVASDILCGLPLVSQRVARVVRIR